VSKNRRFQAGFVQFDIQRGAVRKNAATVLKGLTRLAEDKVKLAVLPEMWTSGHVPEDLTRLVEESEQAMQDVRKLARRHRMVVVGSSYERSGKSIYNTAYVVDADGSVIGQYRKIHLFSPGDEHLHFQPGAGPLLVSSAVGKLGVTICYDLRFPELYRNLTEAGAEVIVVPAQWPVERVAHWETLLRARAIENQVFVIGCNRTGTDRRSPTVTLRFPGASAILDPWGRTLAQGKSKAAMLHAEIDLSIIDEVRKRIPVWKDRNVGAYRM
jgi:predicted amidohydrolase